MKKYKVESSSIDSVSYDVKEQRLILTFKKGNSYSYDMVAPATVCKLLFAESIGKSFHAYIRKIPATKLEKNEQIYEKYFPEIL